jgi:RNA polymerase sigma-70 factor (ECF subfamily)
MRDRRSDNTAEDDRAAVEAVRRGDREAFRGLVERYQRMVASVVWRFGIRADDVDDLVSEIFLKAFRNLPLYRPEHAFSTWLYRLAANHAVDHRRRRRAERGRTEMPEQVADDSPGPDAGLEREETIRRVREALERVDPRYREAMQLVYIEGLKVEEAARMLGIPEGTVKTRLLRGREAMRRVLSRSAGESPGGGRAMR